MTEQQYQALCATCSKESSEFRQIAERYRNGLMSDDDFLVAKERHSDSIAAFDKAYEIIQRDGFDQ